MGNLPNQQSSSQTSQINKNFLQKINKVSQASSQKLGQFDIYQLKQKPYDYYLQYVETLVPNKQLMSANIQFYKNLPKNKNLVPVQYLEVVKRKQYCAELDQLRMFAIYYNFTLEDAIKLKIKQKSTFSESEAVYILKSLLSIGKFYQNQLKSSFYSGIYKAKNIFVSPQGHIKIYPFNQNVFYAFMEKKEAQQQLFQASSMDTKKISIQMEQKIKPYFQTRDESGIFKSTFLKPKQSTKKTKINTTLKRSTVDPNQTQQILKLKGATSHQISRHQSNTLLSHQESSQTFNYLFQKLTESKGLNRRDLFELGLLMMQILLLNEDHEYYKDKQTLKQEQSSSHYGLNNQSQILRQTNSQQHRYGNSRNENKRLTSFQNNFASTEVNSFYNSAKNIKIVENLKRLQEYQSQSEKIPNVDLICFSIIKLLPKRDVPQYLIQVIQRMILGNLEDEDNSQFLDYDQLYDWIDKQQQSKEVRYCLRFEKNPQVKQTFHSASYMLKNKPSNNKTMGSNIFQLGFAQYEKQKCLNASKQFNESKQLASSTKKLQNLLGYNNLSKSFVMDENSSVSSTVLNNLKKSRKLIPNKIRSISAKLNEAPK